MTEQQKIAMFIKRRGVTRCPTAAVGQCLGVVLAPADVAGLQAHEEAKAQRAAQSALRRKAAWGAKGPTHVP